MLSQDSLISDLLIYAASKGKSSGDNPVELLVQFENCKYKVSITVEEFLIPDEELPKAGLLVIN